ncbi:uncharacterized protein LOC111904503 [Lactuca sativa]|uniref:Uncharacterized protein n=1 Tax=Lactuca sativa TaxID=4236 RepID=A0A9R1XA37_LACSA|nr:uncharacterized protein LOC111904503 [Lactuca sativa]KAJ0202999.1 hypothetical protein LSAT_V11C500273920 [Lactuca sativa]
MKTYAIVLIVCASVTAIAILLCFLCKFSHRKTKTKLPVPPIRAARDLEIGKTTTTTTKKDAGVVILAGVAAAVIVSASGGGGCGSGGGCGGGGCGGGGCGG